MIKLKVREQALRYAKTKKAKMLREEEELEKKINILQGQIDSWCNNVDEKLAINIQLDQMVVSYKTAIDRYPKRATLHLY